MAPSFPQITRQFTIFLQRKSILISVHSSGSAKMGISVIVYDSSVEIERCNTHRMYMFEEDLDAVLTALARTMRLFADPARRAKLDDDRCFGRWLISHESMLRP